jgi:alpha-L-fucosidase 2
MVEMLVQSQHDVIDVLPALPKAWTRGNVAGLRARGDVTVSVDWDACGARRLQLQTGRDGPITLRSTLFDGGQHTFKGRRNGDFEFTRGGTACER